MLRKGYLDPDNAQRLQQEVEELQRELAAARLQQEAALAVAADITSIEREVKEMAEQAQEAAKQLALIREVAGLVPALQDGKEQLQRKLREKESQLQRQVAEGERTKGALKGAMGEAAAMRAKVLGLEVAGAAAMAEHARVVLALRGEVAERASELAERDEAVQKLMSTVERLQQRLVAAEDAASDTQVLEAALTGLAGQVEDLQKLKQEHERARQQLREQLRVQQVSGCMSGRLHQQLLETLAPCLTDQPTGYFIII